MVGFASADLSEPRKGAAGLAEALGAFKPSELTLLTFGSGQWPHSACSAEVLHLGRLSSPRLQSLFYSALDVFAAPSRVETFCNTALEAMACATPVVAYHAGGLAEVIVHDETGLLERDVGSVGGMARMLQWMQEHPLEREKMGTAARHRVVECFTDQLMAERYIKLYEELMVKHDSQIIA